MTPIRNHNPHLLHQIGLDLIQDLHQALGEEVLVKIGGNVLGIHSHSHLFLSGYCHGRERTTSCIQ